LGPLDLDLQPGAVLAFIGPNGAGKTTTLNCMVGLSRQDRGSIEIYGRPNRPDRVEWKHSVGYVGEHKGFYQNWTAAANLRFLSRFYPQWNPSRVDDLARRLALPLSKRVGALSSGNRAKLAVVAALGHGPGLLLLDEPFTGLDPVVRSEVIDVLWEYLGDGTTAIMYSTHILSDINRLADELGFLVDGRLILRRAKDQLADSWRRISFRTTTRLGDVPATFDHMVEGEQHRLTSWDFESSLKTIRSHGIADLQLARMSIEEIAVEIMKGHTDVATAQG
jgi:ABC-2 type transport system ATP-binding protein